MLFKQKKYLFTFLHNGNQGYSLLEMISAMIILGIVSAIAAPHFFNRHNDPVIDGTSQVEQILQQIRGRAIATTSAIRLKVDENNPKQKLSMEISTTRGCDSTGHLSAAAEGIDTELQLVSTRGFEVGDQISVGSDSNNNEILAVDESNSKITLGTSLGSSQPVKSKIELLNNWIPDAALLPEDLTLPENAAISSETPDWTICFNSRGIASLYDDTGTAQGKLVLTIQNTINKDKKDLTILKGGAIEKD
jgi:prepilin-type N-terminal cleavage/methylation domain-containing protein